MEGKSNQSACRSFLDSLFGFLFGCLTRLFEPVLDLWQVLKLARFAVLTLIVTAYFLTWNSQGQEVLTRLHTDERGLVSNLFLLGAVILWAWVIWYSCRVILNFQFAQWPPPNVSKERKDRIQCLHRIMPRFLGVTAFLVVAFAIFSASSSTESPASGMAISILYVGCAGLFVFILLKRHRWAEHVRFHFGLDKKLLSEPVIPDGVYFEHYHQLPKLRKGGIWVFIIGLSLVPFLLFQTRDLNLFLAPLITSPAILLLASASWVPMGTILVYWSGHYRIPIFTILFLYFVLVSPLNDNHQIRTMPTGPETGQDVRKKFTRWAEDLVAGTKKNDQTPVILIAAEGGGIRAAYWTASVLTRIQGEQPDFASHTFVISSVSGGSLGAGLFAALIADQDSEGKCSKPEDFLRCARKMLKRDFLAPTFATMLYPDLLQRFLFWPIRSWDRASTLEISWEQAWNSATGIQSNRFAQPFENLWSGPRSLEVPSLIFNMTSVEHGNRVLMSNLKLQEANGPLCLEAFSGQAHGIFDDVIDLREAMNVFPCNVEYAQLPSSTVPLSTAINNSARFSFVSPAGTVNKRLHIVDGGYFENSGTTTLEEVYQNIRPLLGEKLVPIILYIANESNAGFQIGILYRGVLEAIVEGAPKRCIRVEVQGEVPGELQKSPRICPPWKDRPQNGVVLVADMPLRSTLRAGQFYTLRLDKDNKVLQLYEPGMVPLDEVVTPFSTIFNARLARGSYAVQHLRRQVLLNPSGQFIPFQIRKGSVRLPLGWTLSEQAAKEMDRQLETVFQDCKQAETLLDYFDGCWPKDVLHGED